MKAPGSLSFSRLMAGTQGEEETGSETKRGWKPLSPYIFCRITLLCWKMGYRWFHYLVLWRSQACTRTWTCPGQTWHSSWCLDNHLGKDKIRKYGRWKGCELVNGRENCLSISTASPYMDLGSSGIECVPDRFGVLPPLTVVKLLLSTLSASPLDMCLLSGSCGDTGKAGVDGGWALPWREAAPISSGVLWPLAVVRRPISGLGGTPVAAALRPISGLEGTHPGRGCLLGEGLAWPNRLWRAGLGGVLVATVRCSVLGLPGTVWTPMMLTVEPSGEGALCGWEKAGLWGGSSEDLILLLQTEHV